MWATLEPTNPGVIEFTLTMTMPWPDWLRLRDSLAGTKDPNLAQLYGLLKDATENKGSLMRDAAWGEGG